MNKIAGASHAAPCSPVQRFRSARRQPPQWSRRRRRSRRSARRTPNIRLHRRATNTATAASTSNLRMHANSWKGTSARAAGASCLPRRPSPSRPRHFPHPHSGVMMSPHGPQRRPASGWLTVAIGVEADMYEPGPSPFQSRMTQVRPTGEIGQPIGQSPNVRFFTVRPQRCATHPERP